MTNTRWVAAFYDEAGGSFDEAHVLPQTYATQREAFDAGEAALRAFIEKLIDDGGSGSVEAAALDREMLARTITRDRGNMRVIISRHELSALACMGTIVTATMTGA